MKILSRAFSFLFLTGLLSMVVSCSSSGDDTDMPDTDNDTNSAFCTNADGNQYPIGSCLCDDTPPCTSSFTTVSQNKVNQEFFIEAIQISGPGSPQTRTVPHSTKLPLYDKEAIASFTDINVDEVTFITFIGQRLSNYLVTDSDDITRMFREGESYDSAFITFVISDDVVPNAVLTTDVSVIRDLDPFNDLWSQTNTVIEEGQLTITLKDPADHVLGNTLNDDNTLGDPIESITFIANPSAFQDPSTSLKETNGTMVAKWMGDFQAFYDPIFTILDSKDIAIIRRVNGINGIRNSHNFYGIPN